MPLRPIDLVWNRAATEGGGADPRSGDAALAAMLRCHSAVASGGMTFAVEDSLTPEEISAGISGYRFFGLDDAAFVFEGTTKARDELEGLGLQYAGVVPTDDVLAQAFEAKYMADPDQFAPPPEGA